jgi:branched-chain amino acid transport system substrate-binding protein
LSFACETTQPSNQPIVEECTDAIGCVSIAPGEPIQLGVLQALSGGVAPSGIEQSRSIELAIARRGNQLLGHPIEVQIEDSRCSPEGGVNAALNVVTRPQIVAVLGTTCSGSAKTALLLLSEAGLVMISGSNSAPSLTAIDGAQGAHWQPGYLRTRHNDIPLGWAAATYAFQELGLTRAATINDGDIYTEELTDVFKQAFVELGGEIVLDAAINKGDVDMRPVLTAIAASQAEILFFPVFQPEGDFIVRQSKEVSGLENIFLVTADALLLDNFIEAVGPNGAGIYFVGPAMPEGPANNALVSEFKSRYGEPPSTTTYANAYDATNLLLNAIETVAVQGHEGTLHIGRQALRDALYATSGLAGVTGTLTCDEFGDCGAARFSVVRLDDPSDGIEGLRTNVIRTYNPDQ